MSCENQSAAPATLRAAMTYYRLSGMMVGGKDPEVAALGDGASEIVSNEDEVSKTCIDYL